VPAGTGGLRHSTARISAQFPLVRGTKQQVSKPLSLWAAAHVTSQDAGIPFYWLVWLSDDHVLSINIHVLDHTLGYYRLFRTLTPEQETSIVDVPIRIQINWNRLTHLIRQ
jgi:hypothetical protein